jgi:hypothetical protein
MYNRAPYLPQYTLPIRLTRRALLAVDMVKRVRVRHPRGLDRRLLCHLRHACPIGASRVCQSIQTTSVYIVVNNTITNIITSIIISIILALNFYQLLSHNHTGADDATPPVVKSTDLYETVRQLGRGSFGDVNLVKSVRDNKL